MTPVLKKMKIKKQKKNLRNQNQLKSLLLQMSNQLKPLRENDPNQNQRKETVYHQFPIQ